ncbi:MAG: secretin N-terminal domain-containing protein [Planctomycetota bacterium]
MKRLKPIMSAAIVLVVAFVLWWIVLYDQGPKLLEQLSQTEAAVETETDDDFWGSDDINEPEPEVVKSTAGTNEPNTPGEPAEPNKPAEPNEPTDPNDMLEALNLKDVEMKDIIKKLAEWTGKVVIPTDEAMKQKITIYSAEKLPRNRALAMIYAALQMKGFVAEHVDNAIHLKPIASAKFGSVPTIPADYPIAAVENKSQVVRKFFKLTNYSPTQMGDIILPLIGDYGYVSADENTGTLLVIDTVENLIGIDRIIAQFDIPEFEQTVTEIFELDHGDPAEIVQLLRKLLGDEQSSTSRTGRSQRRTTGRGARPSSSRPGPRPPSPSPAAKSKTEGAATSVVVSSSRTPIVLIPDPKRKWIIAKASAEDIKQIDLWIEKLDRPEPVESESETIPVTYADVREVATQIDQALQSMPGTELKPSVLVRPLAQSKQIMIFGRPELREMVKKLIAEIDIPSGQFEHEVFKLKYADPEQIKENIEGLYEQQSGRFSSYSSRTYSSRTVMSVDTVRVIAFPMMQEVTVIASPENMKKVVEQIERWDVPIDVNEVKPQIFPLKNSDPVQMAELLTTLFTESTERLSFMDIYLGRGQDKKKIVGPLYGQLTFEAVPDTKKIIVISNIPEAYDVVEELISDLDKQEMGEVPGIITLNYADPEDLAERLNAIFNEPGTVARIRIGESGLSEYSMDEGASNQSSSSDSSTEPEPYTPPWTTQRLRTDEMPISNVIGRVRFIPDPRTKAILVLAPPEFMENIEQMVEQLDVPGKQVRVKAIIVEVDHRNLTSLGMQLASNPSAFGALDENAITALTELTFLENYGSFTLSAATDVTVLIDFLAKKIDAKILNQQTLWTKDNKEADFFKGQKIAFNTDISVSDTGGRVTSGIEFQRVGMTLRVRPSITPEKNVDMTINLMISQRTSELIADQPVRTEMDTETTLIVKDGETVMLGGMLFQEDSVVQRKVPFFADLPVLGSLFRHSETVEANTEMLVFITPYVIDEDLRNMLPETIEELEKEKQKLKNMLRELNAAVGAN